MKPSEIPWPGLDSYKTATGRSPFLTHLSSYAVACNSNHPYSPAPFKNILAEVDRLLDKAYANGRADVVCVTPPQTVQAAQCNQTSSGHAEEEDEQDEADAEELNAYIQRLEFQVADLIQVVHALTVAEAA